MPNYNWPPMDKRSVLGKRVSRLDGMAKSSGKAKYPSDVNRPGMLFGVILTCPHAHAKVESIDVTQAKSMPGVSSIRVTSPAGTEIHWAGTEVAWVAADTEQHAIDASRAIQVKYEVLPHFVNEEKKPPLAPVPNPPANNSPVTRMKPTTTPKPKSPATTASRS